MENRQSDMTFSNQTSTQAYRTCTWTSYTGATTGQAGLMKPTISPWKLVKIHVNMPFTTSRSRTDLQGHTHNTKMQRKWLNHSACSAEKTSWHCGRAWSWWKPSSWGTHFHTQNHKLSASNYTTSVPDTFMHCTVNLLSRLVMKNHVLGNNFRVILPLCTCFFHVYAARKGQGRSGAHEYKIRIWLDETEWQIVQNG